MRLRTALVPAVALLLGLLSPSLASADPLEVVWRDSLRFRGETEHGDVELRLGGRLHFDTTFGFAELEDDASGNAFQPRDGMRIRRARVDLRGSLFDAASFRVQYDFAGQSFADAYVRFNVGPGNLTAGQSRAPLSFSHMTSSNSALTMERNFVGQIFGPGRHLGVAYNAATDDNFFNAHVGFFRGSTGGGLTPNPHVYLAAARFWLSLLDEDDTDLHVGLGVNHWFMNAQEVDYRTRPAVRLEPSDRPLSRTVEGLDGNTVLGLETAFITGALRTTVEFGSAFTSPRGDEDSVFLWAVSGSVGYLLNGGTQRYSAGSGNFGNPRVEEPLGTGGTGLFELVAHFDYGDLSDGVENGNGLSAVQAALGLNWYMNNNMRAVYTLGMMHVDGDGTYFMMGLRLQANF